MKIYISFPITIPDREKELRSVAKKLYQGIKDTSIKWWGLGEVYYHSWVSECDVFIFTAPGMNKWKFDINLLPSGVNKELCKAMELNKPIYMVYQNIDGDKNFYEISFTSSNIITGIVGSSHKIFEQFGNYSSKEELEKELEKKEEIQEEPKTFLRRLLL